MALESLSNSLQALSAQPYVMNLRSQSALTNDVTWDVGTQYFINDVVRSPTDGGMYVYEAWDGAQGLPWSVLGGVDPASAGGSAAGWAPMQGNGLKTVVQASSAVTGGTGAGALVIGSSLSLALLAPLGVVSKWLVKLDYTATLGTPPFVAAEHAIWTVTPNGTGAVVRTCTHSFGATVSSAGSPVSVVVTLPADGTTLAVAGTQSATATTLTFAGGATATFARLS
jgi:hypothetical protein